MGTDALEHQVGRMGLEALGQLDIGHFGIVEAVGLLARLAEEVGMLVVVVLLAVAMAQFVFRAVAGALDGMYEVVLTEEGEGPEDVRLVDGRYPMLQLCQRLRQHGGCQSPHHDDAVGGGFDTMLFEQCEAVYFIHNGCKDTKKVKK